jgi:hypothetical protein
MNCPSWPSARPGALADHSVGGSMGQFMYCEGARGSWWTAPC